MRRFLCSRLLRSASSACSHSSIFCDVRYFGRLATSFETILGGPVLASIVTTAKVADSANLQPLRNLHQVKSFISSPVMLLLFDAPLAPIYFATVFLIHPYLG